MSTGSAEITALLADWTRADQAGDTPVPGACLTQTSPLPLRACPRGPDTDGGLSVVEIVPKADGFFAEPTEGVCPWPRPATCSPVGWRS